MNAPRPAETDLYAPVKAFLTERGFDVKGEVRGCDLVALHGPGGERVAVVLRYHTPPDRSDAGVAAREHLLGAAVEAVGRDQEPAERVMGAMMVVPVEMRAEASPKFADVGEVGAVEELLLEVGIEHLDVPTRIRPGSAFLTE
ncbi:MAG: hypothetical protein IV100_10925 [Myxococcales bacterium]|nr:hypothetical protein [Myxococcales bacterium]